MERIILICFVLILFAVPAFAEMEDTICGVSTSEFPKSGREITRYTCVVDGESVFDKWVHGLALAWVNASSERFFQILTDYPNWRRNVCNVDRVRLLVNQPNYRKVEWKVLNDGGSTRYTNEYFLFPDTEPKRVEFQYVGPGEVDDMKGEWSIFLNQPPNNEVLIRYIVKLNPETVFTDVVKNYVHRNLECLLSDLRAWGERESEPVIFE